MGPPGIGGSLEPPSLTIVIPRRERDQAVDYGSEKPIGALRGLLFAMILSLVLLLPILGGLMIWVLLH